MSLGKHVTLAPPRSRVLEGLLGGNGSSIPAGEDHVATCGGGGGHASAPSQGVATSIVATSRRFGCHGVSWTHVLCRWQRVAYGHLLDNRADWHPAPGLPRRGVSPPHPPRPCHVYPCHHGVTSSGSIPTKLAPAQQGRMPPRSRSVGPPTLCPPTDVQCQCSGLAARLALADRLGLGRPGRVRQGLRGLRREHGLTSAGPDTPIPATTCKRRGAGCVPVAACPPTHSRAAGGILHPGYNCAQPRIRPRCQLLRQA